MDRDNAPGAANQQERLDAYLAGFVDGEGTFHVAVCRSSSTRAGLQLVPEFHVSQNPERRQVLDLLRATTRLRSDPREPSWVTRHHAGLRGPERRLDLLTQVIPFFEAKPLLSSKQQEFVTFATIVRAMAAGEHLQLSGFEALNARAAHHERWRAVPTSASRRERRESSETICRTPRCGGAVKRWSDLHGDMQSQAEMIWPRSRADRSCGVTEVSVPILCGRRRFEGSCP